MTDPWLALCATGEVADSLPAGVTRDGASYAVFLHAGAYYVTQDLCTHGPGLMSEGYVEGEEVECPFHQGRFNFITGAATAPPCTQALRTWTARIIDGQICIDPAQPPS